MDIADMVEKIRRLREQYGVDLSVTEGLDLMAQQELIQSLSYLSLAAAAANKAYLLQTRALAESPYRE
jgi:hypothetical protein